MAHPTRNVPVQIFRAPSPWVFFGSSRCRATCNLTTKTPVIGKDRPRRWPGPGLIGQRTKR